MGIERNRVSTFEKAIALEKSLVKRAAREVANVIFLGYNSSTLAVTLKERESDEWTTHNWHDAFVTRVERENTPEGVPSVFHTALANGTLLGNERPTQFRETFSHPNPALDYLMETVDDLDQRRSDVIEVAPTDDDVEVVDEPDTLNIQEVIEEIRY